MAGSEEVFEGSAYEVDTVPKSMTSLRRSVAGAAFASGTVEMLTRALTIVLSIATARALQPTEVGLLGLAVILVGVPSLVTACAESAGVIGRSLGSDQQYAWSATVARAVITTCLLAVAPFLLPPLAHLLAGKETASADLMALAQLLLWQLVIDVAVTYPRVLLQRRLTLTLLVSASLLQITTHVGLSLVLLREGYGAFGVACSTLISAGLSGAFLWCGLFAHRGLGWGGKVQAALRYQILASTTRVFAGSFVGYLNRCLDNLLVAWILGPAAMSFYGMAWSASRIPMWVLQQALGLVLIPALTHIRSDTERVERMLSESLRHAYLLLLPVCAALFITADSLVTTVLGVKWLPIVPALRVMSVSVLMAPLVIAFNGLLVAMDRAHLTGLASGAQLVTIVVLVVPLATRWGVVGAAFGDLGSTIILSLVLFVLCRLRVPKVRWEVAPAAVLPVAAATSAGLVASVLSTGLPVGVMKLASEACVLAVGYLAIIWVLGGRGRLEELAGLVREVARRPAPVIVGSGRTGDSA